MNDRGILAHMQDLVGHEDDLRSRAARAELREDALARLNALALELDQCCDLLNQRRSSRKSTESLPREAALL